MIILDRENSEDTVIISGRLRVDWGGFVYMEKHSHAEKSFR